MVHLDSCTRRLKLPCYATLGGHDEGGLADGDEAGGGCAVTDGGGASAGNYDGGRGDGWDCPVGGDHHGRDANTLSRAVGVMGGTAGDGCGGECRDGGNLYPGVGVRPSGEGTGGIFLVVAGCDGREKPDFRTSEDTDSGESDSVVDNKGSDLVSTFSGVSIDEGAPDGLFDWADNVSHRSPGGGVHRLHRRLRRRP